jgi:N-acetylneuraminic acid mutarotase
VAYDPAAGSWRRLPTAPAGGGLVVWTGREMIGWGGGCCGDASNDGAAYTPGTDSWRRLAPSPLPGSQDPIGAWTGKELVVVVGAGKAAAYDPRSDSWRRIARLPASNVRFGLSSAVWTGKELIVGGFAYDPAAESWRRLPSARVGRSLAAVWDGNRVLLVSGAAGGSSYSPADNAWTPLSPAPLPAKLEPTAVWTGRSLIVWGGVPTKVWGKFTPAGAIFTPVF